METTVIDLDRTTIDMINLKTIVKTRNNEKGMIDVMAALALEMKEEKRKERDINPLISRAKQNVLLARISEYMDCCKCEMNRVEMSKEDSQYLVGEFHYSRDLLNVKLIEFFQYIEKSITNQKDKLLLRLKGFSKDIVDSMQEMEDSSNKKNAKMNTMVYELQALFHDLVCDSVIPELWQVVEAFEYVREPIILMCLLQLVELVCSHSFKSIVEMKKKQHFYNLVFYLSRTIASAFEQLREFSIDPECVGLILHLTMKALRALLSIKQTLDYWKDVCSKQVVREAEEEVTSRPSTGKRYVRPLSPSDPRSIDHTSECIYLGGKWSGNYSNQRMGADVTLWCKVVMQAKQGLYDFPALYCRYGGATRTFGNDEEYDENPLNVESTLMQIVLGELWQYTAIGSGLVTNVLYCVECLTDSLIAQEPPPPGNRLVPDNIPLPFGSMAHELLLAGLDLGKLCTRKYSVRMGDINSLNGLVSSDLSFYEAADEEAIGALNCASLAFSHYLVDGNAVEVLTHALDLAVSRIQSFTLMTSVLRLSLSAVLCCMRCTKYTISIAELDKFLATQDPLLDALEKSKIQGNRPEEEEDAILALTATRPLLYTPVDRMTLAELLGGSYCRIMPIIALHRQSLTIAHTGLLIVRLLLRDLFIKRSSFEELMEQKLLVFVPPLFDRSTHVGDDDDEEEEEFQRQQAGKDEKQIEKEREKAMKKKMEKMKPDDRFQLWKGENLCQTFNLGVKQKVDYNLTELLNFLGENHIQVNEVMEQLLLLIEHMGEYVKLSKYPLVDNGLLLVSQRFLALQSSNAYMIALAEMCVESLDTLYG